jgi:nucleotide-binding universal stress UspA family protein
MSDKPEVRPVLVPVDFSCHSEAALIYAVDLARCLHQPVLVLHVVHDPGVMPGYHSRALKKKQLHRIEDGAADMLAEFLKNVLERHSHLSGLREIQSMLIKGLPSTRIMEVAKQQQASLIVLGSKGLTGLKHLMIGSVAERVVHMARTPVVVVKSAR